MRIIWIPMPSDFVELDTKLTFSTRGPTRMMAVEKSLFLGAITGNSSPASEITLDEPADVTMKVITLFDRFYWQVAVTQKGQSHDQILLKNLQAEA